MAVDPTFIDNSAGAPSYSGADLRLGLIAPHFAGAGQSLGVYSGVRLSGSGTDLLVQAQASPNMTVRVQPGCFVAQGAISSSQGPYGWALDTVTNLTISAAHATLARTDLIVVRIRDANVDTSGQRDGNVVVVTGTAGSGTPSLPTDASYFTIAQISVPAAVTNIGGGGGGTITDKRTFCASLGGVLPFVSTARPTSCVDGQPGWETDTSLRYTYRSALSKWMREPATITVTSDQSWTSNTTFADMSSSNTTPSGGLGFAMEANCRYDFELRLHTTSTVNVGLGVQGAQPTGSRADLAIIGVALAGGLYNTAVQNATSTVFGSGQFSGLSAIRIGGSVLCGGTAGTFKFQFAQAVSNAAASWVLIGTSLIYRQAA